MRVISFLPAFVKFSKPFMPEPLARVESLDFLSADEKRTLNQIRGNSYLCVEVQNSGESLDLPRFGHDSSEFPGDVAKRVARGKRRVEQIAPVFC